MSRVARTAVVSLIAIAALVPGGRAGATISGTNGQVTVIAPPASVDDPGLASGTTQWAWNEQQGVTLASPVHVDITTPGDYETAASRTIGTISAGTVVDSHYFDMSSVHDGTVLTGTLTFPTDVLGVITTHANLVTSNVLGNASTDYTSTISNGLELLANQDGVNMPDLRTVTIRTESHGAADFDQVRIITKHDSSPTANAGGPYLGSEASPVTLHGTATDPESDPLHVSWSFSFAQPVTAGTVCTPTNTSTFTPTLTCNDNAVVTASMSVNDPYNPPVVSTATVTISNVAPVLGGLAISPSVGTSTPATVSANFTDVGTNDTHTATIDWGDNTSSPATITETNGSGSLTGSHTYALPSNAYTVTVTLSDDDGGSSVRSAPLAVNGAPTANAGGPYSGNEGSTVGLTGTASDPENDPLTTQWSFTPVPANTDAGTVCTPAGTSTLTPTITCNDDALVNTQLSVSDTINAPTLANTTVVFSNVAPTLSPLTTPAAPIAVGAPANVSGTFTDPGTNDTHTASVSWGDMATTNATITEALGSGSLAAGHAYAQAGLYTVTVTLTDDNGGTSVRSAQILVNSPPVVSAGGPYVGTEGSTMALTGTATDVDGDHLTYTWGYTVSGANGVTCTPTGAGIHALTLNLVCTDDATVTATLTADDGVNTPVPSAPTTLEVGNVAPTVTAVTQDNTAPVGATVAVTAPFTDPGTNDTHTATIDWGDGHTSIGILSETNGSGTVTGSHLYATDGSYTVTVTVTDDDHDSGMASTTVLSDTTPPVITPHVSPGPNGAGWNNGPVSVTWSVTDSISPITSMTGCDPSSLATDTAGATFTCSATSRGGTATQSVTVQLDQTAPTLTGAATTSPNANGWYNSPVTIHWTCSDALSGIAGSCPSNSTLNTEGSAVSANASVADVAGNVTNAASSPVKIDLTAPVTTASAVPTWSNADVVLALSATDNLSGVATTNFAVDGGMIQSGNSVLLTTEGTHTVAYWSTDLAGNVENVNSATVRIDKTAPTITHTQAPGPNGAGWNNTDVTVTFICGDSLSGIASCTTPQTLTSEGAGQTVTGQATDEATNTATDTATVKIDKTPPTIQGSVPAANANGWYNAPVTATFACNDSLSGVASCANSQTLSNDGAGQTATGVAFDAAGNSAASTVNGVNIDQTPPTISASIVPAANASGWNNGAVTVQFTCADATSGLAPNACPGDQNVSAEGISTVAGSVTDLAGNTASASIVVRIDTIAPGITGAQTPAANGAGWNNSDVTVSFTCTDSGSGIAVAGCTPPVTVTEGANQTVVGTAVDSAGNTATANVGPISVDETAPTLVGTPTTAPNGAGWYDTPVTIHWSCSDALSGIAGSCPADSVINSEGVGLTASAMVSDVAGNTTTAVSAPVKIDLTAPATTVSSVPAWSNNNVTLTLSPTDNLSGVASTSYTIDGGSTQSGTSVVLTTEGVHTVQFWSTDVAGNVESAHTTIVRIDKTAPTITSSQSPPANGAGWNNTNVTVTFLCSDALSGIASCTSPQSVTGEGAGQTVTGQAVDNASNTASTTATVNIDKTAPLIQGSVPPANANGWYNAAVTATWTCSDGLSGIATCPSPTTLSGEGSGQSMTALAVDAAGNISSANVTGINIDETAPTITATVPATTTGWYAGSVTVHWSCTDNLSGVVTCPADQTISAEGVTTLAQTITDKAGNATTGTITVRIDETPPTIVGSATPAPNANGWNNTNVTVSFACADLLSGNASCSAPSTLGEGAAQSVTGAAVDLAGNTAHTTVGPINVDETAPTLSGAATTAANGSGWYNHAVTVHWTCADALSGVDPSTCPPNTVLSSEGTAQQVSKTVLDLAGNAATASSPPVNIDLTPPLTSASSVASGGSVTVTFTATDNLSGVASTNYTVDGGSTHTGTSVTLTTAGTHTLTFYSVDNAGNVEGVHVATVTITADTPTITYALSPAPNGAGWNKSNVTVTFTCADAISGIASCTAPQTVTTEGAGQHVAGTAISNAGTTATATATVNLDKTAPTISGTLSAAPNSNGWYKTPVSATFACGDTLSGVASCSSPVTFNEGANQTATGTAKDVAGNQSTKTVGPVNVDLTKPIITVTLSGTSHNGVYTGPVTVHYTCSDALSGIATGGCPADRVVTASGTTTVSGTATDRAGNTSTTSVTITIKRVCEREQDDYITIGFRHDHASYSDGLRLKHILDDLSDFLDPSHCYGDNHFDHGHGRGCFDDANDAVSNLQWFQSGSHGISSSDVNAWIGDLADGAQVVTSNAISDAISSHGSATWISHAQTEMAAGDQANAANNDAGAIVHYENAWWYAQQA